MAEELQHLIERIQTEAVDKAKSEADTILSDAHQKAASIVREAEEKASSLLEKAGQDAQEYTVRSKKALEQAARDLLITVGQGVENVMADMVSDAVNEALTVDVLKQMMVKISEAYAAGDGGERIEFMISKDDQKELLAFFTERYRQHMMHGIEIHTDNEVLKGFKVGMENGRVYQDFTNEAIAEALSHFLRPHLAEIVSKVANRTEEQQKD